MSVPLITYRVYSFDGQRMSVSGDFIEAASDEEAIASATAAGFGSKCELWDGKRLVAKLESEMRAAQRPGPAGPDVNGLLV